MRTIAIGRADNNDVVVNDPKASRYHLQIAQHDDGHYTILDLGSTNGTEVNGEKISGEVRLSNYDIVKIGNSVLPWQSYFKQTQRANTTGAPVVASAPVAAKPKGSNGSKWIIGIGSVALAAVLAMILYLAGGGSWPEIGNGDDKHNEGSYSPKEDDVVTDFGLTVKDADGRVYKNDDSVNEGVMLYVEATKNTKSEYKYTADGAYDLGMEKGCMKYQVTGKEEKGNKVVYFGYGGADKSQREIIRLNVIISNTEESEKV